MNGSLSEALRTAFAADEAAALVTLAEVKGSTPREAGAAMVVSERSVTGTIGGGTIEWDAIAIARGMLAGVVDREVVRRALGPDLGQCCGGHVTIVVERATAESLTMLVAREDEERSRLRPITIYGAGHVGRALARALDPLPFRTRIVDARGTEIDAVTASRVDRIVGSCTAVAESAEPGGGHVVLTHSHALDSLVCASLLERGDFMYLGLIGSATKRATFVRAFRDLDISEERIARLVCPIGGTAVRDKRPAVIAALVAAEIVATFLGGGD
ncbi:xanthine dehydrogenase accessory protein XdhC [Methylobacterium oryzae]|uniref:xanthine dehydrogenase accessory protein XdhC n=1 Tax=Methylobacterium oryzae TaxID=334852 RepID=UPI002F356B13